MFICGNCKKSHRSVETARRCYAGDIFTCGWLYPYQLEGEQCVGECDAAAWETDRGFTCEAGHEHVTAQKRLEEGWDYAADPYEAAGLARVGVEPVAMDGGAIDIDPYTFLYG